MAESTPQFTHWLDPDAVASVSRSLGDSPALSSARQRAFEAFLELPMEPNPLYRKYGYFAGVDLSGISPSVGGSPVRDPPSQPQRVQIVHDATGSRMRIPPDLERAGVRVEEFARAQLDPADHGVPFLRGLEPPADRLGALALALVNRGYRMIVPGQLPAPVVVEDFTVLSAPHEALSVRRSIQVGPESRLLFAEQTYSTPAETPGQRLYASSVDVDLGGGSQGAYLAVHGPDPEVVSVYQRHASVGPSAKMGWVWTGFGGFRTKVRNSTELVGNGSDVEDLQTFFGTGNQAYDSAVNITHLGTDTHGQSITRGVFRDESRGMSRGLVRIEPNARKTISFISEHAMLLSRKARSDTIPILEILCRDVKATHSTSVAPVDPEKVFYLESRGLTEQDSVRMIAEGFLSHVLERAPVAQLRELLYPILADRWENVVPRWGPEPLPALANLAFAGDVPETEWRFDTKLR